MVVNVLESILHSHCLLNNRTKTKINTNLLTKVKVKHWKVYSYWEMEGPITQDTLNLHCCAAQTLSKSVMSKCTPVASCVAVFQILGMKEAGR